MSFPTGTVTFLITDIVGSTARWVEGSMEAELRLHDEASKKVIAEHGGTWVKHTGDGVLAAFVDASSAASAALAIHEALSTLEWGSKPLEVRVGLHAGEAAPVDGDYFGLTVSTAARVSDTGHGGQTIASDAAVALIGTSDSAVVTDLGVHTLKDLGAPLRLFQIDPPMETREFPPLRTIEATPNNLPNQLSSFVGREREVAEVGALVADHRLVTVTGVGGAGKTRLTLQVAAEQTRLHADGVWFVELAPVADPAEVPATVAQAVGVRFMDGDPLDIAERLFGQLRHQSVLVVLDNCEHLLDAVGDLVAGLLGACPEVKVLASSREGLGVAGERLWQIPALGVEAEAAELFLERARDAGVELGEGADVREKVEAICRTLDGVPLAIELAAARTKALTLEQIEERLNDRFRLLAGGRRGGVSRHNTLQAAVDWSYRLLEPAEAGFFERLSVFHGGFTLESAEQVAAGDGIEPWETVDGLTGLVEKSLLRFERTSGRYDMLETLRVYAAAKLDDRDGTAMARDRHLEWVVGAAEANGPLRKDGAESIAWIASEASNLTVAFDWAVEDGDRAKLAEALGLHHGFTLGDPIEALRLFDIALDGPREAGREAHLLARRAAVLSQLDRTEEALEAGNRAVDLANGSGDEQLRSRVLRSVSVTYGAQPMIDPGLAVSLAREAVAVARSGDPDGLRSALDALTWALLWVDDAFDEIEAATAELLALADGLTEEIQAAGLLELALHRRDQVTGDKASDRLVKGFLERGSEATYPSEFSIWAGVRLGDWDLAQDGLGRLASEVRGRHRRDVLLPEGVILWMQGRLTEALERIEELRRLGPIHRWHHDFFPLWAEIECQMGRRAVVEEVADRHLAHPVAPIEELMTVGTLRALTQAQVDEGDGEAARQTLDRIDGILAAHPLRPTACVQLATPELYRSMAAAEVSRIESPDVDAWAYIESHTIWAHWELYAAARKAEAMLQVGDPEARSALASAKDRARGLGSDWIAGLLDDLD